MCGGDLTVQDGVSIAVCEYCGTQQTLPRVEDDRKANAFNRANHFRRQGEFDKAIGAYERILGEDETDAEAHWGVVLSRYGIEYVEDPKTNERIPTCHRMQISSILTDADYLAAVENAPDVTTRALYEREAHRISEIQKGILAISQQEKPYDVFICYKETDESGRRTKDSAVAQDIYYQLSQEGYKAFFARITLEDKLGQQYEPYIFAALNTAKVMVVLGTKAEHFNAVWVKNEWSRYLDLMKQDKSRLLIPCYLDMDPYDIPDDLSMLQSQDMSKIGFIQDLIRGIKKVLHKEEPKVVQQTVVTNQGGEAAYTDNLAALLDRGFMALEDGEWEKADDFFEQALNINSRAAEAYLGKFFAEQEAENAEAFVSAWLNAAKNVESVKREVSSVNERIDALVVSYQVEHYLEVAEIKARFKGFDNSYSSTLEAKQELLSEAEELFASNRLLLRAEQFG